MHAVKGAWAAKTFAIAACNDSGGRKARIRISKEERKALVETFIKTYQKSNNGNFPSLCLTQKEVGGSFYTVREIVREIIQENRVLGPAKFPSEEQHDERPFLSLSVEPHSSLSSSEAIPVNTDCEPSHCQSTIEENVLDSNGQFHQRFDKSQSDSEEMVVVRSDITEQGRHEEPIIISSNKEVEDEQLFLYNVKLGAEKLHDAVACSDATDKDETLNDASRNLLLNHQGDAENNKISFSPGNILDAENETLCGEQIADEISHTVEEVQPSQEPIHVESPSKESLGDKEVGREELNASKAGVSRKIAYVEVETFPLRPITTFDNWDGNLSETNGISLGTGREHNNVNSSENPSHLMTKQVVTVLTDPTPTTSTIKAATSTDFKVMDSSAETKTLNGSSNKSYEKDESLEVENIPRTQEDDNSLKKVNNPPLDRINLETWKETTRSSTKQESNPLFAFFNALFTAIAKILN